MIRKTFFDTGRRPLLHNNNNKPLLFGGERACSLSSSSSSSSSSNCFRVGDLTLSSNVILSPLERISDVGFRRLCHQNGAALTWTEMVYCSELLANNPTRGAFLLDTVDEETPTGIQLLVDRTTRKDGWGTAQLRRALERIEEGAGRDHAHWQNIRAIDLNFGCPAPAISRRGAGPAQLRRRSKVRALFEVLAEWKNSGSSSLPRLGAVGAKIRLGNTPREQYFKVYLPVAEAAAEAGLDYLTVHARNGEERSSDPPTWEAIREIKEAVASSGNDDADNKNIKIIGNGDVRTHADVRRMMETTGCDGVMIGRAAMRNPWVFHSLVTGEEEAWPSPEQVEAAREENESWSNPQPAAIRYERFRNENFDRLRKQALVAKDEETTGGGDDWYREWSRASTRRRHLDRMVDNEQLDGTSNGESSSSIATRSNEEEGPPPKHSNNWRRTSNARQWKNHQKKKKKKKKLQ